MLIIKLTTTITTLTIKCQQEVWNFFSNLYINISNIDYDKCERCRKAPATLECIECGTSSRAMKHCYECDKQYHKMFEKETHTRITIKFDQMA